MENNNTRRPAHVGRTILIAVLAVVILVLLLSSLYVVQPNEYGVVRQFGAVVDVKSEPGLYFKIPFVQEMSTLPNTVLLYDLPVSDMISADKTTLIADCFAIWRIENPRLFIETLSGSVSNAEGRINANVYNALKTVLSSMTQAEIISGRDGTLVRTVMATIGDSFDRYGIELIAVETKKIDLPDDNKSAVFSRMISERNNIAAGYLADPQRGRQAGADPPRQRRRDRRHGARRGRRGVYAHSLRGVRLAGGSRVLYVYDRTRRAAGVHDRCGKDADPRRRQPDREAILLKN